MIRKETTESATIVQADDEIPRDYQEDEEKVPPEKILDDNENPSDVE